MRTVELVPGIKSSALGFGCAPILGAVDGAVARRALAVALDEGSGAGHQIWHQGNRERPPAATVEAAGALG